MKTKYKTPQKPMLEAWHITAIKRRIDENLRLRCINVVTTLKLVERDGDRSGKQYLELTSTPFNTVPVIHSAITVEEFGGAVMIGEQELKDTGEKVPCVDFYISAHARYEGNGTGLFTISGQVQPRHENRIFFETDRHGDGRGTLGDSVSKFDIAVDEAEAI